MEVWGFCLNYLDIFKLIMDGKTTFFTSDFLAISGGCKHAIAFLMWLHRRSEEPSPTDVTCYWAKSKLSKVGSSVKYITLKDFGATQELPSDEESSNFLKEVVDKGSEISSSSQILKYFRSDKISDHLGLHQLILKFAKRTSEEEPDVTNFVEFARQEMTKDLCSQAAVMTATQSNSVLWFDLRYARITASKIYDAAHCKKCDGSFVNQVLGVTKINATEAMARGKKLEEAVIKQLEKDLKVKFSNIGLQLDPKYPIFGASPDAICDEYVVEVKCPSSEKTVSNYLTKDNKITAKYKAQVNLQMFLLLKNKCLFCVADPNFEKNFKYSLTYVDYDKEYTEMIMESADCFWRHNIFPHLYKSAFTV